MPADPAPPGFIGYKRGMMVSAIFPMPIPFNVFVDPASLAKVDPAFKLIYDDIFPASVGDPQGVDASIAQGLDTIFYENVNAKFHFTQMDAPSLHCEFEGSRIRDVYNALDFAHVHCDTSGFWDSRVMR